MPRVRAGGVTLNVIEIPARGRRAGRHTPIVFVHGLAASSAFWYAAGAPVFSLIGPCTLYDLRGHGRSEAPETGYGVEAMAGDLIELLDALGIDRAHLVAHSFGGMIALLAALKARERVASLVLADVRVRPLQERLSLPRREIPRGLARRLAELGVDLDAASKSGEGVDYLSTMARIHLAADEGEADDLLAALYRHPRLFRSRRNAERWIALVERASLVSDVAEDRSLGREDLARISLPLLILAGGASSTLPSARRLAEIVPGAVLREVPGVGHFFPMSHPRLFVRPTLRFLRSLERGPVA